MDKLKLILETNLVSQQDLVNHLELYKGKGKSKEYYHNLGKLENIQLVLNLIKKIENE